MPGRSRYVHLSILVLLAAACVYLVGNSSVPLWDRDEPRYAQASRQMLRSGDWVVVRYLDELRTKKPPLIYWCQAASMKLLGQESEFAARLPSTIGVLSALAVLGIAIGRWVGAQRAFWTLLVCSTSLMVVFAAKVCLTDGVLFLWITIGQLCLFAFYRGDTRRWIVVLFWLAVGLGILNKGVNVAFHAVTILVLAALDVGRRWKSPRAWLESLRWCRRLRPLMGLPIVAAVLLPWVLLIYFRSPEFIKLLLDNIFKHTAGSAEGHAAPPGYYLLSIWPMFLPWSLLLPMAMVMAWKRRRIPHIRFALAAVIGPWIVLEIFLSKLPHYLLPAYPALAFLTADVIIRGLRRGKPHLTNSGFVRGVGVWAAIVGTMALAPWIFLKWFPTTPKLPMAIVSIVGIGYAAAVFLLFRARRPRRGIAALGVGMAVLCCVAFGLYLPSVPFLRTSIEIADILKRNNVTGPGQVQMLDYKEPSLAFYQGGSIREQRATVITNKLLEKTPPWLVITREVWNARGTEASARDKMEIVGSYTGLDVADGMRGVEVMVVRRKPETPKP